MKKLSMGKTTFCCRNCQAVTVVENEDLEKNDRVQVWELRRSNEHSQIRKAENGVLRKTVLQAYRATLWR